MYNPGRPACRQLTHTPLFYSTQRLSGEYEALQDELAGLQRERHGLMEDVARLSAKLAEVEVRCCMCSRETYPNILIQFTNIYISLPPFWRSQARAQDASANAENIRNLYEQAVADLDSVSAKVYARWWWVSME